MRQRRCSDGPVDMAQVVDDAELKQAVLQLYRALNPSLTLTILVHRYFFVPLVLHSNPTFSFPHWQSFPYETFIPILLLPLLHLLRPPLSLHSFFSPLLSFTSLLLSLYKSLVNFSPCIAQHYLASKDTTGEREGDRRNSQQLICVQYAVNPK